MCQEKVYLLERHYSGGKLYHRHCCREAERSSTLKLNKENLGSSGDKKDSLFGGRSTTSDANKAPSVFSGTKSSAKVDTVAPTVSKPSSTSIMTSLFVPSKYPSSGTSGVSSEASKVPADTPKTIATASSGTSAQLSPFVPKTTSASRTGIWGLAATTTASNPSSLTTSNYLTSAAKASTPTMSTTVKSSTPVTLTVNSYTPVITTTVKSSTPMITTTVKSPTPVTTNVKSFTSGIATTVKSPGITTTGPVKSSTPGTNTTVLSKLFGNKGSTQPFKDAATVNTPKTTNTAPTTTVSSFLISNPKSALSSGSKLTPGTVSAAATSSSGTSKYTSIFASRTTPTATPMSPGTTTSVQSAGYISTITTTVSGQVPSHQTGLKDVTFTFNIGNSNNTSATVSSASGTSNKPVASTFLVAKSPTGLGSGGKGATEGVKSGKDTSPKAEWQLEAERRQKTRNGVYVDPEKYPQRDNGPGVSLTGPVENERIVGKKEIDSKKTDTKSLVTILQKQLNTKGGPNRIPSTVVEEVPPQTRREDSSSPRTQTYPNEPWVFVERPGNDDTRPGISRSPPFRVPDTEFVSVETHPLSPPEMWKKVVTEGKIGFLNPDQTADLSKRHSFESSPHTFSKQTHVVRNPSVPKRKVSSSYIIMFACEFRHELRL